MSADLERANARARREISVAFWTQVATAVLMTAIVCMLLCVKGG